MTPRRTPGLPPPSGWWRIIAGTAFGFVLVGLALHGVPLRQLGQALGTSDWRYLPPIVGLVLISGVTRAVRCRVLLGERSLGLGELFSNVMVGVMANDLLPMRLGEVVRIDLFRRRSHVAAERAIATIAMERCLDLVMVIALFVLASFVIRLPAELATAGRVIAASAVALAVALYVAVFAGRWSARLAEQTLPDRFGRRVGGMLERFSAGLGALASPGRIAAATLMSALTWAAYAGMFVLYLPVAGLPVQATVGLGLLVATSLAAAIPGPPGFIGTYHLACRVILQALGYPAPTAAAVALLSHAVQYFASLGIGLICWMLELRGGVGRAAFHTVLREVDEEARVFRG